MATLLDARGNEFQGHLDQIGGGTFTDARVAGATISATNGELVMDIHGKAVAVFEIRSAANSATYVFEGTVDGTNYFTLPARPLPGSTVTGAAISEGLVVAVSPTAAIAAAFAVSATGYRRIRCRSSITNSGSAVVTGRATQADYAIIAQPQPSIFNVTLAPALATGGTITLPAAAGMFHYVTGMDFTIAGSGALQTVGAAVFITTTNLPGNPAWGIDVPATAAGASRFASLVKQWANPLKSSVANTNTTFVFPVPGNQSTLRANVQYYLGA